jgi:hypothetical protein
LVGNNGLAGAESPPNEAPPPWPDSAEEEPPPPPDCELDPPPAPSPARGEGILGGNDKREGGLDWSSASNVKGS